METAIEFESCAISNKDIIRLDLVSISNNDINQGIKTENKAYYSEKLVRFISMKSKRENIIRLKSPQ